MIAICRTHYASTLVSQGQWDDAQIELREAIDTFGKTHPGQAAEALVRLADLRIRQGRLDEAAELLDEVQSGPARMMGHKIALAARSALLLERGDACAAIETAERFLRSIRDEESLERTSALEVILRAHIVLDNEPEARNALARLRGLSDSVNTAPMRGAVLLAQGELARAFADPSAARTALEDASDIFEEVGMPLEAAQARLLLAFCLHDAGDDQAAAGHARDALSAAQALGATTLIDGARRLLEGLGQPPATAPTPFAGLTLRETEILGLIARGLSNHDIATRLVLSVRTVERHVSNIYLKLDLEGSAARAGATAAALQHGLI
jgi:ATP/maltotriose-dependent transcriptional regulator MalT